MWSFRLQAADPLDHVHGLGHVLTVDDVLAAGVFLLQGALQPGLVFNLSVEPEHSVLLEVQLLKPLIEADRFPGNSIPHGI
jgi:hypothetical protein